MNERGEKDNQRLGLLSTIGIHGAMLALFFFAMGWRAPNPPLSDMGSGIELNFGLDNQGSGDVQPLVPVGQEDVTQPQTTPEEVKQDQQKAPAEVKPEVTKADEKLTSDEKENPEIETPKKKEVIKKAKEVAVKPVDTKTKETVADTKKDDKKTVKVTDTKSPGDEKKGTPGNQGDDQNKTGDKGNPKGTLDSKALYGNPGNGGPGDGGGGGGGVSITGFDGFERPTIAKPEIPSESYGTYTFEVKVDKDGTVVSIKSLKRGSSLEAERIFKETIQATEFIAKFSSLPGQSVGVITFNVVPPPTR